MDDKKNQYINQKKYRQNHPERVRERNQRWRHKNKDKMKLWKSNSPEKQREYTKNHRVKLRKKVFELLGNKCSNPDCPIPKDKLDTRCLQIDHVHGGGNKERKKQFQKNYSTYLHFVYRQLKSGSKEYQLLCVYCNWKKKYENNEQTSSKKGVM